MCREGGTSQEGTAEGRLPVASGARRPCATLGASHVLCQTGGQCVHASSSAFVRALALASCFASLRFSLFPSVSLRSSSARRASRIFASRFACHCIMRFTCYLRVFSSLSMSHSSPLFIFVVLRLAVITFVSSHLDLCVSLHYSLMFSGFRLDYLRYSSLLFESCVLGVALLFLEGPRISLYLFVSLCFCSFHCVSVRFSSFFVASLWLFHCIPLRSCSFLVFSMCMFDSLRSG